METLNLYERFAPVPENAKREIRGGRLNGKTDINPMWRIKTLTEAFGPCGIGWGYEITRQWTEAGAKGEVAAFCNINLWIMVDGKKSEPIPGTGGSSFIASEKSGLYTSDECYKMALTDAISVACKALGIGADVYWSADSTKYTNAKSVEKPPENYNEAVNYVINFGKYSGKTIGQVWKSDVEYIKYLNGNEKTDANVRRAIGIIDQTLRERNAGNKG